MLEAPDPARSFPPPLIVPLTALLACELRLLEAGVQLFESESALVTAAAPPGDTSSRGRRAADDSPPLAPGSGDGSPSPCLAAPAAAASGCGWHTPTRGRRRGWRCRPGAAEGIIGTQEGHAAGATLEEERKCGRSGGARSPWHTQPSRPSLPIASLREGTLSAYCESQPRHAQGQPCPDPAAGGWSPSPVGVAAARPAPKAALPGAAEGIIGPATGLPPSTPVILTLEGEEGEPDPPGGGRSVGRKKARTAACWQVPARLVWRSPLPLPLPLLPL